MRKRFFIGGFIVCLAIGYLGYIGFGKSASYYLTVSELVEKGELIHEKALRVNGTVLPGSIVKLSQGQGMEFTIADEGVSVPVMYKGIVPDTFKDGVDIVVEGKYNANGVLQANNILAKCPSKYAPDE